MATDRIAYPALRWAGIEARLRQRGTAIPRDGSGTVCEVYPAAALRVWELPHRQYKGPAGRAKRAQIVEGLDAVVAGFEWNGLRESCLDSDDVLDALISALIAREADAARTVPVRAADQDVALSEGWIHVPQSLGGPGSPT